MIIESKKTGRREAITKADWEKLRSLDMSRNFTVVSSEDEVVRMEKTDIPVEVVEFIKQNERKGSTRKSNKGAVRTD